MSVSSSSQTFSSSVTDFVDFSIRLVFAFGSLGVIFLSELSFFIEDDLKNDFFYGKGTFYFFLGSSSMTFELPFPVYSS